MRLINLEQGTDAWKEWREERCMASEAPIIMGVAPDWWQVRTWDDLRAAKAGFGDDNVRTDFMERMARRGHVVEERVRKHLVSAEGIHYTPAVVEHRDGTFAGSLDGLAARNGEKTWLEVKAPAHGKRSKLKAGLREARSSGMDRLFARAGITDVVWWQLVHQAYVVFDDPASPPRGSMLLAVIEDDQDMEHWQNLYRRIPIQKLLDDAPALVEAWESYLTGRPQVPSLGEPFLEAAARFREAKMQQEKAAADVEAARKELLSHIGDREKVSEGGVKITKVVTKGRTNWKAAAYSLAAPAGIDEEALAEDFRGKDTVSYRITA